MLVNRRKTDDEGSAIVSVLVIMLVLALGAMTLAAIVTNTTGILSDSRGTAQSRAAADAGLASGIAAAKLGSPCSVNVSSPSAPKFQVVSACANGKATITATGTGSDGSTSKTTAVYEVIPSKSTIDGALVSGDGNSINISGLEVSAADVDGDLFMNKGSITCSTSTTISGDVILRGGGGQLTNYCVVGGSLFATGDFALNSNAHVKGDVYVIGNYTASNSSKIDGDLFVTGTVTMNSGTKVGGDITALGDVSIGNEPTTVFGAVRTAGSIKINAATITGAVTSSSTADADFYNAKVGAITIAGRFAPLQKTTVTGSVVSTKAGASNSTFADTSVTGDITLAGTLTNMPAVSGTVRQNVTGLVAPTAPTFATPDPLLPESFVWSDLPFNAALWAGYAVKTLSPCSDDALLTAINAATTPTIIDARTCTGRKPWAMQIKLKSDVVVLIPELHAQAMNVTSANGAEHIFNIITPDGVLDGKPTCKAQPGLSTPGEIFVYNVTMHTKITGIIYSPCSVQIGSGSGAPRWNGQIYAGNITWSGGDSPRLVLDYRPVNVPGLVIGGSSSGGAGQAGGLGTLLSLRDTP